MDLICYLYFVQSLRVYVSNSASYKKEVIHTIDFSLTALERRIRPIIGVLFLHIMHIRIGGICSLPCSGGGVVRLNAPPESSLDGLPIWLPRLIWILLSIKVLCKHARADLVDSLGAMSTAGIATHFSMVGHD